MCVKGDVSESKPENYDLHQNITRDAKFEKGLFTMRSSYRKLTSVLGTFALLLSTLSLAIFVTPNAIAQIRGLTVDFAAAEPTSYNHLTGGGQWVTGDVNKHISRSLAGDDFKSGEIVS